MPEETGYPSQLAVAQSPSQQRETVRKVFYQGNPGTSDTLLYTSPNLPGARSEVLQVGLHLVSMGASSAVSIALFYAVSVTANTTVIHDSLRLIMEEGYMLRGLQSVAAKLCITITGLVEIRRGGLS